MADTKNALAELAEEMKEGLDCLVCVPHLVKVYGKAQRIVAEVAKVETASDLVGLIGKFHAIAEEGANDGK